MRRADDIVGAMLEILDAEGFRENTLVMFLSDNGSSFPFAKSSAYLNSTKTPWIIRWPGVTTPGSVDTSHFISTIDYMPTVLEAGNIQGYCVGEPWNQQAVAKAIGVPVTTNYDVWKNNPEKVFGVTKKWNDEHPNTHIAVVKALIRAGKWLDATDEEVVDLAPPP